MDDDDNSFQEANLLLSTALKQLDDALNKGAPPSNIYRIYTESIQDLPRYTYMKGNGNTNGYNGYSDHRRAHSPNSDYKNANILEIEADVSDTASYENNNNNMNGHGHHNGHGNGHLNGHGHGSIMNGISKIDDSPHRLAWEATITNWDDGNEPKESSISSSSPDNFNPESPPTDIQSSSPDARMNRVGEKPPTPLRTFIKAIEDERIGAPDVDTTMKILKWLMKSPDIRYEKSPSPSMSTVSCPEYPELQEKLHRLAMARDSLSLQVAVLNEQVGAQKEKIRELEGLLAAKRKLYSVDRLAEDTSEKADLINEIANLKMKYSSLEKEKHDAERRLQMSQSEIDHLSQSMRGMINQPMSYQQQQQQQQQFTPRQNSFGNPEISQEMEQLRLTVQRLMADNEQKNYEINSLRSALDEHARSREIEGYTYNSLQRPQIMGNSNFHSSGLSSSPQPFDINAQLRKLLEDVKENIGHSTSYPVGLNSQVHSNGPLYSTISKAPMQIPPSSSYTSSLSTASPQTSSAWSSASGTPRHQLHQTTSLQQQQQQQFVPNMGSYQSSSPAARQLAAELDELRRLGGMTQPSNIKNVQQMQYNSGSLPRTVPVKSTSTFTLPRQKLSTTSGSMTGEFFPNWSGSSRNLPSPAGSFHSAVSGDTLTSSRRGSSKSTTSLINRWLQSKLKKNRRLPPTKELDASDMETSIEWKPKGKKDKRSTSVPNLGPRYIEKFMHEDLYNGSADASSELESDDELVRGRQPSVATSTGNFKRGRTRSTLRNIIGKLTRSTSQEIQSGQFKRGGGIRSSASARMVAMGPPISGAIQIRPPIEQFVDWTTEHVCEWFAEIGFSQYVPEVERYVRSGRHLLNMTNSELDKELLMKNPLHKKRLRCLLTRIERGTNDPAEKMDVHQVMLWLDEIGLPQYRDIFAENLIDGPILLVLTAQDLIEMKITSALNHATIARGIQFLRSADFSLYRLEKRFNAELLQQCPIPNEVEKWTHGCVCQWLASIDLAEFTPNLMFSGVHGALMIHEPSFTAESLAEVLQIPPHKTLLRRHLTTQFNNLVGQDIIQRKREVLAQPYMTFLNPSLKIRLAKKGFSLARKKSKNEVFVEPEVPVCPPKLAEHKNEGNTETIPTSNV